MTRRIHLLIILAWSGVSGTAGSAADAADTPRITAASPLIFVAGEKTTLRLRGWKLKVMTTLRIAAGGTQMEIETKDRKDAGTVTGFEPKEAGDSEVSAEVAIPADWPAGDLKVTAVAAGSETAPCVLRLAAKDCIAPELEPNNGFQKAQVIGRDTPVTGRIAAERDVDVFRYDAGAGQKLRMRVRASGMSLMDPLLYLYDSTGHLLATNDDSAGTRDAMAEVTAPGPVFAVVHDAHDHGSDWHGYQLTVEVLP